MFLNNSEPGPIEFKSPYLKTYTPSLIWITGASSGIGEALALEFARKGASLILTARREAVLEEVAKKCRQAGAPQTWVYPLDMSDEAAIFKRAEAITAEAGLPELLINNAGISQRSYVKETEMKVYRRIMEVDFFGAIALTKALLPAMVRRGSGQIAVLSSLAGKFGTPMRSGYCAAKHALHGFFDALRAEYHQQGIGVTLLCPSFIQTEVSRNALTASGEPLQKMDDAIAQGMPVDVFARKAAAAIGQRREEVILGGKERMGAWLHRFFPRWFRGYLRKAPVR